MLDVKLILKFLRYRKVGSALVAFQIALTFAIVCNVSSISNTLFEEVSRPTGIDLERSIGVQNVLLGDGHEAHEVSGLIERDLSILRNVYGVNNAAVISDIPLSGGAMIHRFKRKSEKYGDIETRGYAYLVDENVVSVLGLDIVKGRNFRETEVRYMNQAEFSGKKGTLPILITEEFARKLFPEEQAVGRQIEVSSGRWVKVVGLIRAMSGAWAGWEGFERVALYPGVLTDNAGRLNYLLRTEEGGEGKLISDIENKLFEADRSRVIVSIKGLREYLSDQYKAHRALLMVLLSVAAILIGFAASGNYSLTSFTISRQTRQIGIMRALGASRTDIIKFYAFENLIIMFVGLFAGCVFTVLLNSYLVHNYAVGAIDWFYIPIMLSIYLFVTLLAVYVPAKKAVSGSVAQTVNTQI